MKSILPGFLLAAVACAQPALTPPQIGFFADGSSSLRPVLGIAGNFVLGNPAAAGIVNAAYSGSSGLLKTDTAVIATGSQGQTLAAMDAPPGQALFAFSGSGAPAFAYLPGSNLLFAWYGSGFQMVPFDCALFPAGAVISLSSPDSPHAVFLIQRDGMLWEVGLLLETGEADSQTALPGVRAPALRLASGELIYADSNDIVIRKADSSAVHLAASLPASFAFEQMGAGWVLVRDLASSARLAIRVTQGREAVYSLPEVSQ